MPTPASEAARGPLPRPPARTLTRREGLIAAALLVPAGLLAACSSDDTPAADSGSPTGTSSGAGSATSIAADVATDEAALIALYDAAVAALPAGDDRLPLLTGIRDQHAAHLEAVAAPAGSVSPEPLPGDPDAVLAALSRAERQASRSRIRAGETADGELARLLVFIAASESGHAAELRRARA